MNKIKTNKKKGFTLIELIVVMAVLAVLVLLAAPKFLGHTKEATFTKHINNAKVLEDASERYYIDHGQWPRGADDAVYTPEEVSAYADKIYDITGEELVLEEGKYWDIDYEALATYAKPPDEDERANYVLRNPVGKVYYLDGLTAAGQARVPASKDTVSTPEEPKELTADEINSLPYAEWVAALEAKGYVMATDADFTKDTGGNWRYTGSNEYVIVPYEIDGKTVTSYQRMFQGKSVKGVASNNRNVVDMNTMFIASESPDLELLYLDTSQVMNMQGMFHTSKATELDLSTFDTSKVIDMSWMFYSNQATTLTLSNFDTSTATNMSVMFSGSQARVLDIRSFNTENVTNMNQMFSDSQATTIAFGHFDTTKVLDMINMFRMIKVTTLDLSTFQTMDMTDMRSMFVDSQATIGYARTQADADRLNKTSNKPAGLTFTVK